MDAAVRVREMNDARDKIGGEPFLRGDDAIKEALEWGLCQKLVLGKTYDESLQSLKDAKQERERIAAEKRAERERIAAEKRAEKQRIAVALPEIAACFKEAEKVYVKKEGYDYSTEITSTEYKEHKTEVCSSFSKRDQYETYLSRIRQGELNSSVSHNFAELSVLPSDDLIKFLERRVSFYNKMLEFCQLTVLENNQELEIYSEGIKLHCQKNSEGCHRDWIAEG